MELLPGLGTTPLSLQICELKEPFLFIKLGASSILLQQSKLVVHNDYT